eukprot:Sro1071_g237970.1 n/a (263) ;mRNA; r:25984-26772
MAASTEETKPEQLSATQQELESCLQLLEEEGPGYLVHDSESITCTDKQDDEDEDDFAVESSFYDSFYDSFCTLGSSSSASSASSVSEFNFGDLDMTPFLQLSSSSSKNAIKDEEHPEAKHCGVNEEATVCSDSECLLLGRATSARDLDVPPQWLSMPQEESRRPSTTESATEELCDSSCKYHNKECSSPSVAEDTVLSTEHGHDDDDTWYAFEQEKAELEDERPPAEFDSVFHEFSYYYCNAIREVRSQHMYVFATDSATAS